MVQLAPPEEGTMANTLETQVLIIFKPRMPTLCAKIDDTRLIFQCIMDFEEEKLGKGTVVLYHFEV